ncbi:MAG: gamma-glutamyltransferase family protein [Bryobacteraceae bacterium]
MPPTSRTTRPVIRGRGYAVSTRKPQAAQVAENILRAGGNAFDAAVAAHAVLAVTDPAMTGFGGDAHALIYDAQTKSVLSINAAGAAPQLATIDWYNQFADGKIPAADGLLSASLPGAFDACYLMLDRWGTMTFREVLSPAIELAIDGFAVSEFLAAYFAEYSGKLRKYPSTAKIYLPDGELLKPGAILRNPDLAGTLTKLIDAEQRASREFAQNGARGALCASEEFAQNGVRRALCASEEYAQSDARRAGLRAARDCFYKGEIARTIAAFSEANGGLYRYEDFAAYEAKIEPPVFVNYRGYDVYKNPSATQGPTELIFLNLLESLDLASIGHNTPDYIHASVEAAKLAYADREKFLGDAEFIQIPFAALLSKQYARERAALIDWQRASMELRPGTAGERGTGNKIGAAAARANLSGSADHHGDTSYVAVVDRNRNAVSFTPSLHSAFGTGVAIEGLGLILNCRGDLYDLDAGHPNALVPGKRPRSTLTPTIVLKNGAPFLIVGSPGGDDQPLRIAQTFLNIADFGMNIQDAIEAPRWSTTSFPASEFPHTMYPGRISLEDRIPEPVRLALEARGHLIEVQGPWTMNASCGILIDPDTGVLSAGADPRGDSYALAW